MNLIGKKITLRPLELNDMPLLNKIINDKEISDMVVGWSKPVTMEEQNTWFKNLVNDKNIRYAICEKEAAIGTATIRNIDWKNRSAALDIKIDKNFTKKGYGCETITLLIEYCFNELNMNRIYVNILKHNKASEKLFAKCGFVNEGMQKEAVYKNGEYHDLLMYSILKKDYQRHD